MRVPLLHQLFDHQAIQQPEAIAICAPAKKLTYAELGIHSQSLAKLLYNHQAKVNKLIAVVMEKGWEQVVAVLGILKSGAAYLPVDPSEPTERLHYLINTGEVEIILTQSKYVNALEWPEGKIIIEVDKLSVQSSSLNMSQQATAGDLAYVIFTSGSTGAPKGVMISHQSAVNTILAINNCFSINESDKIFALSSLTFDLSVYDIFGTLAAGATIVLPSAEQAKDPTQWHELFFKEQISVWNSVPALMDIFAEYLAHKIKQIPPSALRVVLLSGDWLPLNLPQKIRSLFGNIQISSLGGATEASIWSIMYPIRGIDPDWRSIPYGKAMKNQAFHILDEQLKPVENGKPGELFIGGIGVAKGYWRDPVRTKAQFIQHLLYGLIYKTGDLGRYLPDGNIEFLGRVDFQVKISGYRIEINAIEKYLLDFPGVTQALVLVSKEEAHQKLVAYLNFDYDKIPQINENYASIRSEQINYWQKIYDDLCREDNKVNSDVTFNTAGWISSYHNELIPNIQMQEWLDNTVKRIALLKPRSVLEIGCGTGLLLFRLAGVVNRYDATDFSKSAIEYVKSKLPQLKMDNVELIECGATEIKNINNTYDTILLNSVVQYFPTIDYFVDVLNQCIDKIKGSGYIFLGDVRSLHLLKEFHASILLAKEVNYLTYAEWNSALSKSVEEEDELIIDFNFFHAFKAKNPRVTHVEVLLKEGLFQNEMNCYRYDVILYIDQFAKIPSEDIHWENWCANQNDCSSLENIHSNLSQQSPNLLAIKNVPNKRTIGLTDLVNNNIPQPDNWHKIFEEQFSIHKNKSIDPEIFYEIANEHNYYASITWSSANPAEYFDVIFINKSTTDMPRTPLSGLRKDTANFSFEGGWGAYANFPLLPRINRKIILEVKNSLQARLPYYMIPTYFVPIKGLPITANGKIDRKSLPLITRPLAEKKHVKPYTKTQAKLVAIWQKLLGLQNISIKHSFADLGGTSLLAVQLIISVHNNFGIDLSLQEITSCSFNIENLGSLIEKRQDKPMLQCESVGY